ncbi:MAG: coxE [Rhodospirillales bacterium]|nr:coxE [Rhodospirillales bacterium]
MVDMTASPSLTAGQEQFSGALPSDYITLLKPRVMFLVVFTGLAGLVAAPTSMNPILAAVAILSIALATGGAGAVNMWYDRDIDAIMERTRARPIPMGVIEPSNALAFGTIITIAAICMMGLAVNWLSAGILAAASFTYIFVYTVWLKRRTPQNIVIGGAAGAFPPMIGWAAATDHVGPTAISLFLITFFWTPPHFWALSLYRCGDYARAGIPMMSVTAGPKSTKRQILAYTLLLFPFGVAPYFLGAAGPIYLAGSSLLGLLFIAAAIAVLRDETEKSAKRMFGFSILYLFLMFGLLMIDTGPGLIARLGG